MGGTRLPPPSSLPLALLKHLPNNKQPYRFKGKILQISSDLTFEIFNLELQTSFVIKVVFELVIRTNNATEGWHNAFQVAT